MGAARRMIVAEGNGPVHALDTALRQALSPTYPALEHMHLADYKVRIQRRRRARPQSPG